MSFPLSLSDLSLWLAATAITLLITSELLMSIPEYSGRIRIDTKRIRLTALGCGAAFLITVAMHLLQPT
jgi:hypothetical protein